MKWIVTFCIAGMAFCAPAQSTKVYTDPLLHYKNGLQLFEEENYMSARKEFENYFNYQKNATDNKDALALQNIEFYIAASAAESNDKDAELLLLNYYAKYHETDHRKLIYLYLGNYYYQNNKYTEAAEWYAKVNPVDVPYSKRTQYKFNLAYCYFIKKKFDEAKPLFKEIKNIKEKYYYPSNYYYAFISFFQKDYNEALKSFLAIEDSKLYASVIPYYIAQIYYEKKDYEKTINTIKKSEANPEVLYKDEMNLLLGKAYFQQSAYDKALPILEKYVAKNSKINKDEIFQLAYCYYKTGNYPQAINYFEQLEILDDKMGQFATYTLADCYLKNNQKEKALAAFSTAATKNFDKEIKANALYNFGKLSYETGNTAEAIRALEDYLTTNPDGAFADDANEVLAASLVQTKDYEKAYKIIEGLKNINPTMKETYQKVTYFRAVEKMNDKNYEEAAAFCQKSFKYTINNELTTLSNLLMGDALYQQKKYNSAIPYYLKFAQYCTNEIAQKNNISAGRGNYDAGYAFFKQNEYKQAGFQFKEALDNWKNTTDAEAKNVLKNDAMLRLADCAIVNKNYEEAQKYYYEVYQARKSGADYAAFQTGIVLGLQNKNAEKIAILRDLISTYSKSPLVPDAYFEIGETMLEDDRNNEALAEFNNVLMQFPTNSLVPKTYLKMALANYNSNKKEVALNNYKTVVQKYPATKEAKEALRGIKELSVELGRPEEYLDYAANTSQTEKDSLTFAAIEAAHESGDCDKLLRLSETYLKNFPKGFFTTDVHIYRTDCFTKLQRYVDALPDYEALIAQRNNRYYEKALLNAAGICYFEKKDYEKALHYYELLADINNNSQNYYTAIVGAMRAAYTLQNNDKTIYFADKVIAFSGAKEIDYNDALYYKGKAAYNTQQLAIAYTTLNKYSAKISSEKAAEAKYLVAKILYDRQDYKASNDTCFKLKNKFASYEYWVVKAFLLIADNYYALGNTFQAKATLESIIANYEGDPKITEEASAKLDKIKEEELGKSKLNLTKPEDDLQMDNEKTLPLDENKK